MHGLIRHVLLQCNSPAYTGTGSLCGRDSDRDTLPDVGLECEGLVCEEVMRCTQWRPQFIILILFP